MTGDFIGDLILVNCGIWVIGGLLFGIIQAVRGK